MPLWLAAESYGAKQLALLCQYWMSAELAEAMQHEQWKDIPPEVKAEVKQENQKLLAAREKAKQERELLHKLPCLLMSLAPVP